MRTPPSPGTAAYYLAEADRMVDAAAANPNLNVAGRDEAIRVAQVYALLAIAAALVEGAPSP